MRRIAWTAWGVLLAAAAVASAQGPASLGTPIAVSDLRQPIATSKLVRGQAADTPTLGVPEPYPQPVYGIPAPPYPPAAPYPAYAQGSYYPPAYGSAYPQGTLASQSLPYPGYDYGPPPSNRGDPVRRTSFSSRSASESRFGGGAKDYFNDCCDWCKGCFASEGRNLFESDHSMDVFVSPVTNPFLFEDPRALTEVRPIFIYQKISSSNPAFNGGSAYFYGTQARLALTDRWSVTLNKLGGVTIDPGSGSTQESASGLAELDFGPKYTFVRNCEWGTAAAVGAIFQLPVGPENVFQDTGNFSFVPYVSVAQNFGRTSYGSFNFMDTLGYSFAIGGDRSDYLYNSAHIDYDVANLHKFYPLLELNWFHYTKSGDARAINLEGRDFANIGGTGVSGHDYLTIAPGFRYKFSECIQAGIATEFGVTSPRDLQDFRLTVDLIFRY
jgi:hypothetical protein